MSFREIEVQTPQAWLAAAELGGLSGSREGDQAAQHARQQAGVLIVDPASWAPASIRPYERVASASAPGLQWVMTATPVHAAEASHILSRLD